LLFKYHLGLALITLGLTIVTLAVIIGINLWQLHYQRRQQEQQGKVSGLLLQLISGIAKLRVAGVEIRAFAVWAKQFTAQRIWTFKARSVSNIQLIFNAFWTIVPMMVIFVSIDLLGVTAISTGNFLAFLTAFGQFFTAMIGLAVSVITLSAAIPLYERAKPILETLPEVNVEKTDPGDLRGAIEMSHVSFRYSPESPYVLNDLSLQIKPGQFVAIVGPSGAGKSSIFRLLLGFDTPESGSIYYDNQDLAGLDIQAVRRQIGSVIQNGRLMAGSIHANIAGSALYTQEDVWEAATAAGIADDIVEMPMGMFTMIPEGGATLSGGQKQRLMIARAIIGKPRILLLDEATSALDNRTQSLVSESLVKLQATRVVIAHRLSTIVNADCIYVLSGGKVVQSGTYDELMEQEGMFKELASRQLI
jgi:NHLM bacteriocin system ABC transporter ATP-binding protein